MFILHTLFLNAVLLSSLIVNGELVLLITAKLITGFAQQEFNCTMQRRNQKVYLGEALVFLGNFQHFANFVAFTNFVQCFFQLHTYPALYYFFWGNFNFSKNLYPLHGILFIHCRLKFTSCFFNVNLTLTTLTFL